MLSSVTPSLCHPCRVSQFSWEAILVSPLQQLSSSQTSLRNGKTASNNTWKNSQSVAEWDSRATQAFTTLVIRVSHHPQWWWGGLYLQGQTGKPHTAPLWEPRTRHGALGSTHHSPLFPEKPNTCAISLPLSVLHLPLEMRISLQSK